MVENHFEKEAHMVAEAIKILAERTDNLQNFEYYLARHFDAWITRFASTPEDMACELKAFANME